MKIRILSSIVGIVLILLLMGFSVSFPFAMTLTLGIVSALCSFEVLSVKKLDKSILSIPCYLFAFLTPIFITGKYFYLTFVLFLYSVFMITVFAHKKIKFDDVTYAVSIISLIAYSFSSMVILYSTDLSNIPLFMTLVLAMPWCADSGAYFIGSFFGKKKLCPEISPKKTVEGVYGGLAGAFLGVTAVILVFQYIIFPMYNVALRLNYIAIYLYMLIGAPASIIGDLSFSILKRNFSVKDYGSIIPGHGGFLDRVDSVIFSAPILFLINCFLPILIK